MSDKQLRSQYQAVTQVSAWKSVLLDLIATAQAEQNPEVRCGFYAAILHIQEMAMGEPANE